MPRQPESMDTLIIRIRPSMPFLRPGDITKRAPTERLCYSWNQPRLLPVPEDQSEMSKDNFDMRKESL